MPDRHVTILGCGVIGLSTAITILEANQAGSATTGVTIVTKEYPQDPSQQCGSAGKSTSTPTAEFASAWAGAHHVSDAKNEQELRHDKLTFDHMTKLLNDRPWVRNSTVTAKRRLSRAPMLTESTASQQLIAEPLVWVHQKELFEAALNPQGGPPYENVLDWYPDVSRIVVS